jgi:hypothetical protein
MLSKAHALESIARYGSTRSGERHTGAAGLRGLVATLSIPIQQQNWPA